MKLISKLSYAKMEDLAKTIRAHMKKVNKWYKAHGTNPKTGLKDYEEAIDFYFTDNDELHNPDLENALGYRVVNSHVHPVSGLFTNTYELRINFLKHLEQLLKLGRKGISERIQHNKIVYAQMYNLAKSVNK